jgi:hypothetical protein
MQSLLVFLNGLFFILLGVVFLWMGSLQMIFTMLPKDKGILVAEWHGAWIRENVFRLPPIPPKTTDRKPNTRPAP